MVSMMKTRRFAAAFFSVIFLLIFSISRGFTAWNGVYATETEKDNGSFSDIVKAVGAEDLGADTEYKLLESVVFFGSDRDSAQGYVYRFDVSKDGKTVALAFTDGSRSSVAIFALSGEELRQEYGFDIALSERFEIRLTDGGVAVWLRESDVLFLIDDEAGIVNSKRLLSADEGAEDTVNPEVLGKVERFFACGVTQKSTEAGTVYFLDSPTDGDGEPLYLRLAVRSADGSETEIYRAHDVDRIAEVLTVVIASCAAILAICAVVFTVLEAVKRKTQ